VSSRLRRIGVIVVASLALALAAAPAAGAALAGGYTPDPPDGMPIPGSGTDSRFGRVIVNAGGLLLVGAPDANNGDGAVVFVNPVSGETQRINAPLEPSHTDDRTNFGASVLMIPDVGACVGGLPGQNCTSTATHDGNPDFLVGAPGADLNGGRGIDMGLVYVLDGPTRGIMKRVQLGPEQNPDDPVPGAPLEGKPDFGRSLSTASGMPPCLGSGGVGACPALSFRVSEGDLDEDGTGDVVIGAPLYRESADSTTLCTAPAGQACPSTGRVYVVSGAKLGASGRRLSLSDGLPLIFGSPISFPYAPEDNSPPAFGASVLPLGDVGSCDTTGLISAICPAANLRGQDGIPDLLASAPGADAGTVADAGAAFVLDGGSATILSRLDPPAAQPSGGFGSFSSGVGAVGDLGATAFADIYVGASGQNGASLGQGQGYVFSGDGAASPFASANDPSPAANGGFGAAFSPIGDVAGDFLGELLIGATGSGTNDVHVYSACAGGTILQTIPGPAGAAGFGNAVAAVGDANGDGLADFAVGAPGAAGNAGRLFIFESDGSPGPAFGGCAPIVGGPDPGGGGGGGGGAGGGSSPGGSRPSPQPPSRNGNASSLAKRTLTLKSSKKKVKVSRVVALSGKLRASKSKRACEARQKVGILRFNPANGSWATVDVAVTKRNGTFVARARPIVAQSLLYRATVKQTKRCSSALSSRVRVKVTN
jgi:hypothetical protein